MPVICKFRVGSRKEMAPHTDYQDPTQVIKPYAIEMHPVSGDPIFGKYTPCGKLEMVIHNPEAAAQLIPGEDYYVTIAPVPKDQPSCEPSVGYAGSVVGACDREGNTGCTGDKGPGGGGKTGCGCSGLVNQE